MPLFDCWCIVVLAVAAAIMPSVFTKMSSATAKNTKHEKKSYNLQPLYETGTEATECQSQSGQMSHHNE
jgi:NADH:ubiquinone oxidoreductase subunit 3 (subunit A)